MILLFVYGTLMKGEPADIKRRFNHSHITFIGEDEISGQLYEAGWFPTVALNEKGTVKGEVYEINSENFNNVMDALDRYEGYPRLFDRTMVKTKQGREAIVYFMPEAEAKLGETKLIASGSWRDRVK